MVRRQLLATLASVVVFSGSALTGVRAGTSRFMSPPAGTEPEPLAIPQDAATTAKARAWLDRVRLGRIDRTQLDPQLSAILPDRMITGGAKLISGFGTPLVMYSFETRIAATGTAHYYRVKYARSTLTWILSQNPIGQVNGLTLRRRAHDTIYSAIVSGPGSF